MDVTDKHDIDAAQPGIVPARHCAARIVEDARAVGIFKDHGAIKGAELAILTAQGRHLHVIGGDGHSAGQ
ncbi:hypothetical protein RE428_01640 [Marinobacter nanhaiticus D15-8W]|nr:hypothetical protein RE428_01640 [Marinobacter nanhaiticus D15-8W]